MLDDDPGLDEKRRLRSLELAIEHYRPSGPVTPVQIVSAAREFETYLIGPFQGDHLTVRQFRIARHRVETLAHQIGQTARLFTNESGMLALSEIAPARANDIAVFALNACAESVGAELSIEE